MTGVKLIWLVPGISFQKLCKGYSLSVKRRRLKWFFFSPDWTQQKCSSIERTRFNFLCSSRRFYSLQTSLFSHQSALAALSVDGPLCSWCLYMRDAHPHKLAVCLNWSLSLQVCAAVNAFGRDEFWIAAELLQDTSKSPRPMKKFLPGKKMKERKPSDDEAQMRKSRPFAFLK